MPIPLKVGQLNKRAVNRITATFAGTIPPFHHRAPRPDVRPRVPHPHYGLPARWRLPDRPHLRS
jgi:hypothetical protein